MSDVQSATQEKLYRAAVGPKKGDHYVPLFLKFDRPGASRASWNWPAFFVTFLWLLYRRMYGYALAYFFLAVAMGVFDEVTGTASSKIVSLAAYIVIPIFANALYHRHVKRVIARKAKSVPAVDQLVSELERGPQTSHAALTVLVVIAVIGFGALGVVEGPAYQDYTVRTQVTEGFNLASPIKAGVAESYARDAEWPGSLTDIGINARISGKYVADISVENGTISIQYGSDAHELLSGRVLTLRPSISGEGDVVWNCGYAGSQRIDPPTGPSAPDGTNVPEKYLPAACRTGYTKKIDPSADP